ncbi:MAG TPA: flagellar export chaperone FlgN [Longimicrobiaceae bacterium]|nr:flagellar export chaperone FlgN [Longimicrobiaceae bacterium]
MRAEMATMDPSHVQLMSVESPPNPAVTALTSAVSSEVRLLEDLIGIMRRQRSAVAADDLQGVDDSVFSTHRVLVTLGEARRQRRAVSLMVGGTEDLALRKLDDLLGDEMTDSLRRACDGLRDAATTLSREVGMNRQVLRAALSEGSEYMHALCGTSEQSGSYAPRTNSETDTRGGLLINRTA